MTSIHSTIRLAQQFDDVGQQAARLAREIADTGPSFADSIRRAPEFGNRIEAVANAFSDSMVQLPAPLRANDDVWRMFVDANDYAANLRGIAGAVQGGGDTAAGKAIEGLADLEPVAAYGAAFRDTLTGQRALDAGPLSPKELGDYFVAMLRA